MCKLFAGRVHTKALGRKYWGRKVLFDTALLASVAKQMMSGNAVDANGERVPVRRTSGHRLRTLASTMDGREHQAIEQNPDKPSRWGQLARNGYPTQSFSRWGSCVVHPNRGNANDRYQNGFVDHGMNVTPGPETVEQPCAAGPPEHPQQFSVASAVPEPRFKTPIPLPSRFVEMSRHKRGRVGRYINGFVFDHVV